MMHGLNVRWRGIGLEMVTLSGEMLAAIGAANPPGLFIEYADEDAMTKLDAVAFALWFRPDKAKAAIQDARQQVRRCSPWAWPVASDACRDSPAAALEAWGCDAMSVMLTPYLGPDDHRGRAAAAVTAWACHGDYLNAGLPASRSRKRAFAAHLRAGFVAVLPPVVPMPSDWPA